jgi:tetratricopeptide (TPR) repeat protein
VKFLLVATALGLTLVGCQRVPAPAPAVQTEIVGSLTAKLKAEGDELMKQQQHEQAVVKYQAALNEAPADLSIRYALAVALSYLPARRDEAVEQFRIVLQRGRPASREVNGAREWLASARELEGAESSARTSASATPSSLTAEASDPKKGHVLGKIVWGDIEPRMKMVRVNVSLVGDEVNTRDVRMSRPDFKIGKGYEFRNVPPGAYRVVGEIGGSSVWDLKVAVAAEKDTTLDLTQGNASVSSGYTPPSE